MIRLGIVALTCLVLAAPVAGQTRWLKVHEESSIRVELDTMRILRASDRTHTIWLRKIFLQESTSIPELADMYRRGTRSLVSQEQIDCGALKSRSVSGTYYTASGAIVGSYNDDTIDWTSAIPESIRELWLSATCAYLSEGLRNAPAQVGTRGEATTAGQLYRDTAFRFRLRFPPGWSVREGDGPNIRQKATSEGATVLVLARDVVGQLSVASLRQELGPTSRRQSDSEVITQFREELDSSKLTLEDYPAPAEAFERFSNVRVLAHRLARIDNRVASFTHVRMSYSTGSVTVDMESIVYQLFRRGVLYSVQASAPVNSFARLLPVMEASLRTFVLEDW